MPLGRAAGKRQERARQHVRGHHEPEVVRVPELEHREGEGDRDERVPGGGECLTEPQQAELRLVERSETALDRHPPRILAAIPPVL